MNLNDIAKANWGKKVRVTIIDGETLEGKLIAYTSGGDNEPDSESIIIEDAEGVLVEIGSDEIERVDRT